MKCYVLLLCVFVCSVNAEDLFELSIIHINDFHARFEPVNKGTGTCKPGDNDKGLCYGGIARLVTMLTNLKDTMVNPVLLNAGDSFQGTLYYSLFKWNVTVDFMNRIPFDATAIGNHEFDDGIAGFVPYMEELESPIVAANINASSEPEVEGKFHPSVVIERGGRSIGIIGCITPFTPEMSSSGSLVFSEELEAVSLEASRLHAEGVDQLILLSHSGYDVDLVLAKKVPHLDVIVGAHSHSFLYSGTPPSVEVPVGEYPTLVTQDDGRKVLVVQAYAYSKYVGVLSVHFDLQGEVVSWEGNPRLLDNSVLEDPETKLSLSPWKQEADKIGQLPIGVTAVLLDHSHCYNAECNIGNFLTDAMVAEHVHANNVDSKNSWTRAAIAISNPGAFRSSLGYSPSITYNDLVTCQPFANTIDTIELQGKDIVEILERSSARRRMKRGASRSQGFMQLSGVQATYNMSAPVGSHLMDVKLRCAQCRVPQYQPVDLEEWYTVAMPSFLTKGGSAFDLIPERGRNVFVGRLDVEVFSKYIAKQSPITQGVEGRINIIY